MGYVSKRECKRSFERVIGLFSSVACKREASGSHGSRYLVFGSGSLGNPSVLVLSEIPR